jgi:hypothetical protein
MLLQIDGSGHTGEGFWLSLGNSLEANILSSDIFAAAEIRSFNLH